MTAPGKKARAGVFTLLIGAAALSGAPALAQRGQPARAAAVQPLSDQGRGAELRGHLRTLADNPRSLSALVGAGRAAVALHDYQAALTFFARAQEVAPGDPRVLAGMGSVLIHLEQPQDALRYFGQAAAAGAPEAEIAGDRGLAHDATGDQARAQADYNLALRNREDPEVRRRLALSLGISGQRDAALRTIADQVARGDRAALRVRTFVLALTGDAAGASQSARSAMPGGAAAALTPFLARLPTLTPAQRAMAVHFGRFPTGGPVQMAGTPQAQPYTPPQSIQPSTQARVSQPRPQAQAQEQRRDSRPGSTPRPSGIRPDERPDRSTWDRAPQRRQVVSDDRAGVSPADQPQRRRQPASAQRQRPSFDPLDRASVPAAAPTVRRTARADTQRATPQQPPSAPVVTSVPQSNPEERAAPAQAQNAAPAEQQPVSLAQAQPQPAAQQPNVLAQQSLPPAESAGTTPAPIASASPPIASAEVPTPGLSLMDGAPRPQQGPENAPANATPVPTAEAGQPQAATPAPAAAESRRGLDDIAALVARLPVEERPTPPPAAEVQTPRTQPEAQSPQTTPTPQPRSQTARPTNPPTRTASAAPAPRTTPPGTAAARPAARAERQTPSAQRPESSRTGSRERTAASEPPAGFARNQRPQPPRETHASRHWVQVAGGADRTTLPREFARLREQAPALFRNRTAYVTPLRATNRLLVGPFPTIEAAQEFVNQLARQNLIAFAWTSPAGQEVERLPAR